VALLTPDLVIVGHVCRDVVAEAPGWRPGGGVYYASATASKLGASVGVLTAGAEDELRALRDLYNVTVIGLQVQRSTSFENRYEAGGRRQFLRALAPPIPPEAIPPEWRRAPVALLAPVADEVRSGIVRSFADGIVGISAQGFMRRLALGQEVRFRPWERAQEALPHCGAVVFSEEDVHGHPVPWLNHCGPVLVMTRAEQGCELIHCGKHRRVAGFPMPETDPTGAGDVFAAAFMLKLRETRDPVDAARYANCVASFSVTGSGIDTLPTREEVQERLATWKPD
jgi:sugar/nucleoside kinase (ribokinase family)